MLAKQRRKPCQFGPLLALCAVICATISGCANTGGGFPDVDPETATYALATGYFQSARELPRRAKCGKTRVENGLKTLTVCFDPPPIRFRFVVEEVLAGKIDRRRLTAFTTNHWGVEIFRTGREHPYLLQLRTDGRSFVIPRNQFSALGRTETGTLAIPAGGAFSDVYWLPCAAQELIQPIRFAKDDPVATFDDIGFESNGLEESYLRRQDAQVLVTHGIDLRTARVLLAAAEPDSFYVRCEEPD